VGNEGGEEDGELLTLREIHWVLQDDDKGGKKGEEKMVEVGVYAAKPTVDVSGFVFTVFTVFPFIPFSASKVAKADILIHHRMATSMRTRVSKSRSPI
jgi:hypothetical protein